MAEYIISCCSTADLTKEHFDRRDIKYIFFNYQLDGVRYPDDLGQTMSFSDFYQKMREGADTKTSQPNPEEYMEYLRPFLEEGKDVLHLVLSSGISGAFNSASVAGEMLREEFPERKIYILDSMAASGGFGLLVDKVADLRDEGMDIDSLKDWVEANKLRLHHWFFTSDLTYLVRGGRVSKVAGFMGNLLNICPLLNVNFEGKLVPREKIRTKKKVIAVTVDKMEEFAENGLDYDGKCYITNSDCMEDAETVAALVEERFPKLNGKVLINSIGTTIGSHTGPGTVALFFWGKER